MGSVSQIQWDQLIILQFKITRFTEIAGKILESCGINFKSQLHIIIIAQFNYKSQRRLPVPLQTLKLVTETLLKISRVSFKSSLKKMFKFNISVKKCT